MFIKLFLICLKSQRHNAYSVVPFTPRQARDSSARKHIRHVPDGPSHKSISLINSTADTMPDFSRKKAAAKLALADVFRVVS
jgi:hypothetical protein